MLLGVVEENRKKEVMENLEVCAELVDKIRTKITELEGIVWVNSSYHKTSEAERGFHLDYCCKVPNFC